MDAGAVLTRERVTLDIGSESRGQVGWLLVDFSNHPVGKEKVIGESGIMFLIAPYRMNIFSLDDHILGQVAPERSKKCPQSAPKSNTID